VSTTPDTGKKKDPAQMKKTTPDTMKEMEQEKKMAPETEKPPKK
jgi:hypothetical protein